MPVGDDVTTFAHALNTLAALYQFRSLDTRLYGALTVSQSYCLRILYFQGAQTMSALAAALHVRLSTMTGIVDQLESRRLVERSSHPEDRRSLQVALTPHGRTLYQSAHDAFLSHVWPTLDRRTAAERRMLLTFLDETIQAIRGWMKHPRKVTRHDKSHSRRRAG
jgi:DNA-binding MarR family transcriptional regulator